MINIGLCGFGYWGPNLLRNFHGHDQFRVIAVADERKDRQLAAQRFEPGLQVCSAAEELAARPDIDALVIATPVRTHYPLARRALVSGKHVFVEKPMCMTVAEGEELVALAKRKSLVLMVDHTFLFTGAVQAVRKLHAEGSLGKVSYYDSMRVNLGLFQTDVNVLWDLAPHDFSVMDFILGEEPVHVEASGYCHVNPGVPDVAYVTLHFASDTVAHFNLSWMSPVKVRRVAIGGSKQMLIWDDLDREEKIKIYNSGISFQPETQRNIIIPDYRIGDIFSPRVSNREALTGVVDHFAAVIRGQEKSVMDGASGLRVLRMLDRAQVALDESLRRVAAATGKAAT